MVNRFLGLILVGEDVNVALAESGVGSMKVEDVIHEIAGVRNKNELEAILQNAGVINEDDLEKEFSEKAEEFVNWMNTTEFAINFKKWMEASSEIIKEFDVAMTELHKTEE